MKSVLAGGLLLASIATGADAPDPSPFLELRDATLTYNGPDVSPTNLTEIRIGWFGPSDAADPIGGDLWWAACLAVSEANAQGGCGGLPVRLVPRWAPDPWGTGVSQLTRMVYEEQPVALLGSIDSAATHLAEQVVAKANLPLVSPVATDKTLTLAGVPWVFSCAPSDDAIVRPLADGILEALQQGNSGWVLLAATDHASRMTTRELTRETSRRGRGPDHRIDVPAGAAPTEQALDRIAAATPAAVVVIATAEDAAAWVQALRPRLPAARWFGGPTLGRRGFADRCGSAAEGIRFPPLFEPDRADAVTARFLARFLETHGHDPDYAAALTYDATRLLLDAIRRAGPARTAIRDALARSAPWQGITGPVQFDGTGRNTRPARELTLD